MLIVTVFVLVFLMPGSINICKIEVLSSRSFFKSIDVFTSRYDSDLNCIFLYPRNINVEVNQAFARANLEGFNSSISTCEDLSASVDRGNKRPTSHVVWRIEIKGEKVREAVDRLFHLHQLSAQERSGIEDALREMDRCLEYNARLSQEITWAQKEVIEFFIDPFVEVLKANMEPWHLEIALDKAADVYKYYPHPEEAFELVMRRTRLPENPDLPVIDRRWDAQVQEEVLESLSMIAKVIAGKANLESALEQSGVGIPTLQTQKSVVMKMLGF